MTEATTTVKTFRDLKTWQVSHELVIAIYRVTQSFPATEQFGLTNQIRRAVVSITSNIAEGFGRQSSADKAHFFIMARGSLTEVQNQLLIAKDISYLSEADFDDLYDTSTDAQKLLTGLIKSMRTRE